MKIDPTIEIKSAEGLPMKPKQLITRQSTKKEASPKCTMVKCQELKANGKKVYSITEGQTRTIGVAISEALRELPLNESPSDNPEVRPIMVEEMKKRYRLIQLLDSATGEIELSELNRRYCEAALNCIRTPDECGFIGIYFEQQNSL